MHRQVSRQWTYSLERASPPLERPSVNVSCANWKSIPIFSPPICVLFELRNPCTTLKPINTHSCNPSTDLSPIQIQNSLRSFESFVLCCCGRVLRRSLILSSCSLKHLERSQGGLCFKHGDGVR
eukprot:TRINITY_DN25535_c0_g1_i1.p1 TRINITY_DN25535_c0_g1~~TRINITY_DN25535_c0_g1_i1.p1  ORF type:complete len:124 (+),score=8.49 TRINITY_DN25535_c0_g1_i1:516-887(+)